MPIYSGDNFNARPKVSFLERICFTIILNKKKAMAILKSGEMIQLMTTPTSLPQLTTENPPAIIPNPIMAPTMDNGSAVRMANGWAIELNWETSRVKMSGLVAGRLFNLLPPFMPLKDKYTLVEKLWREYCPKSHKIIVIGPKAQEKEITYTIRSYLLNVVEDYNIPEPLERRFNWLSQGDVNVKQQILNYFLQKEKDLIVRGMKERIPVLLKHIRQHGAITSKLNQQIIIGKHKLDLQFSPKSSGVQLKEPSSFRSSSSSGSDYWGCLWIIIGIIVFLIIVLLL